MDDLRKSIDSLKGKFPFGDRMLLDNKLVRQEMETQWDNPSNTSIDSLDIKKEMWQNISDHIHPGNNNNKILFLRIYGIAATVLLMMAIGAFFFTPSGFNDSIIYIVCTGNQDNNILTLNDDTKVKLGAGSKLIYPKEFSREKRIVQLEGQAFFDVTEDTQRPFTVEIENVIITALGTSFEVFHDKHNNTIETILLSGKVKVEPQNNIKDPKSNILLPNQKLTVSLSTGEVVVQPENADKYSAWRNYNGLDFTDEKLSVIIPRLEYWYGCQIFYDSEDVLGERFTFKVKNEPLDRILDLMCQAAAIGYKKNEDNSVYTLYHQKNNLKNYIYGKTRQIK